MQVITHQLFPFGCVHGELELTAGLVMKLSSKGELELSSNCSNFKYLIV